MIDSLDRELATALVQDGRLTYQELARIVHLSANSTADRVRRLQQNGVILGYHAELNLSALGRSLTALSDVKLKDEIDRRDFERHLVELPQVVSATHTTGEYDYQLRLACTDTADLERVVDDLRWLGVRDMQSRVVLGETVFDPTRMLRGVPTGQP
ncbi:MAG: Lrp/AsnC family transcriptional regulator [Acidimicrobiaceae bacterium]|nr:Lrp/AsnC family transcriptional regulator [Acidimicrobiaceae bacterium]